MSVLQSTPPAMYLCMLTRNIAYGVFVTAHIVLVYKASSDGPLAPKSSNTSNSVSSSSPQIFQHLKLIFVFIARPSSFSMPYPPPPPPNPNPTRPPPPGPGRPRPYYANLQDDSMSTLFPGNARPSRRIFLTCSNFDAFRHDTHSQCYVFLRPGSGPCGFSLSELIQTHHA